MDIPIRFKFFDKLKLYQDYLKEDSMLEKTKSEYWLYEKAVLFWSYSEGHQHLGRPLGMDIFCKDRERVEALPKIASQIGGGNFRSVNWVKDNIRDEKATLEVMANLHILDFVTVVERYSEDKDDRFYLFPKKITINPNGLLLGELLYETYEKPGFWSRNFRKYKLMLSIFWTTFAILILTVYLVFIEQLISVIKPAGFVAIGAYIGQFLGYSWWSTVTTCFLIFLGLRQIWKRL